MLPSLMSINAHSVVRIMPGLNVFLYFKLDIVYSNSYQNQYVNTDLYGIWCIVILG